MIGLVTILIAAVLVVQTPLVQTKILDRVQKTFLAGKDADISFSKIHFKPFNTIVIRDLVIKDRNPKVPSDTVMADFRKTYGEDYVYTPCDTLLSAGTIIAQFSLEGLRKHDGIHFTRVLVSDGKFTLVVEEDGRLVNLQRIFGIKKSDGELKDSQKNLFYIKEAKLRNMAYSMRLIRKKHPHYKSGIDWCNLDVTDIDADASDLKMNKGIMSGQLNRCSFNERSGLAMQKISGRAAIGRGQALMEDIHLLDAFTDARAKYFSMSFARPRDFRQFTEKIRLDGQLEKSRVSTRTVGFFLPAVSGMNLDLDAYGELHGTVEHFDISKMRVNLVGHEFSTGITGCFKGLSTDDPFTLDIDLVNCRTSTKGIGDVLTSVTGGKTALPSNIPDVRGILNVCMKGPLDDLRVKADLDSDAGTMAAVVDIDNLTAKDSLLRIGGKISTDDLDISRLIGRNLVHQCTADATLHATMRGKDGPEVTIDTLSVNRLNINEYDYSNILATGSLSSRRFNGRIISHDPNFNFLFQGIFTFSPKTNNALYQFYANIGLADLHALNFDQRENSTVSLTTNANFNRTGNGVLLGNIDVNNIRLTNDDEKHNIGNIHISSRSTEDQYRANITSSFIEAAYFGTGSYSDFMHDIIGITAKREMPSLFRDSRYKWSGNRYEVTFKCIDTRDVTAFFKPGLYIDNNTSGRLTIDRDGILDADISSYRLALREKYIKNLDLRLDNRDDRLAGKITSEDINLSAIGFKGNSISFYAEDDNIAAGFQSDGDGTTMTSGEFFTRGTLSRSSNDLLGIHLDILPSGFNIGEDSWSVMPSCIDVLGPDIKVRDMHISSGDQEITIDGGLSKAAADTMSVRLDDFDLGLANLFAGDGKYDIQGSATGEALLISYADAEKKKGILIDVVSDSTSFAGSNLGTVEIRSAWDEAFNRFNLSAYNNRTFDINGTYTPSLKEADLNAHLDGFDIGIGLPFLHGVFSDMSGSISGDISADGPLNNLRIKSSGGRFTDARLTVDYTHVPYIVNGPFHIDEYGVYFDDDILTDTRRGTGSLNGAITYDHFRDIGMNIYVTANNAELIDIPASDNNGFYGRMTGDGSIRIAGPVKKLTLDINGISTAPGEFHIPTSSFGKDSKGELLTFREPEKVSAIDPYEEMMAELNSRKKSRSELTINIKARATQDLEAFLEVDKSTGNGLNGRGIGTFEIESRPARDIFTLKGDYTLTSGKYTFNAFGLAKREFDIKEGSNIKFNGNIMDSDLDIEAIYRTKASLARLISDTTSVNTRRVVECGLLIGDKLSNPSLDFSINIPDLEPSVKSKVENALSTEDKLQKQFIALLVSNNFLPDEQSGVNDNTSTSIIYSSVTTVFTNQLNNILQKLEIPLDVDMRYQQNQRGNDIFDVAVSTQLFNNRVVVNGNIGNRQYNTGNSNSDVVGDLDIEIKLDKSGALRLNLFSHSADQYTNYLDNSQRNGIGFTLQQEFTTFRDMIRKMFAGKKKKEKIAMEEIEKAGTAPRTVIELTEGGDTKFVIRDK